MIADNMLYFQHRNGTHDYLVNATEFRNLAGSRWSVVVINETGHHTYHPKSRDEANDMAERAIATMIAGLRVVYNVG